MQNFIFLSLFSLIGTLLSYYFSTFYINYFQNKIIDDSKQYLSLFYKGNINNISSKINIEKILFSKVYFIPLFAFLFIFGFFTIQQHYVDISFNISNLLKKITNENNLKILFMCFVLIYLSGIAIIDYKTQWLTNESVFLLIGLGLFYNTYFNNQNTIQIYLFLSCILFFIALHLLFPQLPLGKGDGLLLSSFFLFFEYTNILIGLGLSFIIGSLFGYIKIFIIAIYFQFFSRKNRRVSFKKHLISSKLLFKLQGEAFGQWIILGILLAHYLDLFNVIFI